MVHYLQWGITLLIVTLVLINWWLNPTAHSKSFELSLFFENIADSTEFLKIKSKKLTIND
jgi:hypothetical protein